MATASKEPVFDLFSYAHRGPAEKIRLTSVEIEQISRTFRRSPEVMVKVLSRGAVTAGAVRKHFDYIGRRGRLVIETDTGNPQQGASAGQTLVSDWDLDMNMESDQRGVGLASRPNRTPKLVHKILLSMPPGTTPNGVLEAARGFAREEFGLKHRYALAIHTDEPHPHVHLVVKATSEQGIRLDIRKATLREWRRDFARHLRDQGIDANATDRVIRGQTRKSLMDGIYRASQRGESTHLRHRAILAASGEAPFHRGLIATGHVVRASWQLLAETLKRQGEAEVALSITATLAQSQFPKTDQQIIREQMQRTALERQSKSAQRVR